MPDHEELKDKIIKNLREDLAAREARYADLMDLKNQADEQLAEAREDSDRVEWLAEIFEWRASDAASGLPAMWLVQWADRTSREHMDPVGASGTFDAVTLRTAIDAARTTNEEGER